MTKHDQNTCLSVISANENIDQLFLDIKFPTMVFQIGEQCDL